ncbi:neurensin-1 [Lepisosteus oculatus]|uniref:Neurensin 1-like n=1 Tax=Lepisosteus oculatus TaxID=7918 RepID=W5MR62_LEPOC|nr:PREDICTED: neurensin-1 [Lepisosteus oculatus]XP_015213094.1 PREDICTED: neurensin-1 [Lepisosteus oculatus]
MSSCSEICGSEHAEQAQSAAESHYQRYGVRSYLHQFYEDCTASIWERDEDFQIQRSPSRWSSVLWKVGLMSGTLVLIIGLIVIAVGYVTSPKMEAFGEDDLLFVDSHAMRFNHALDICKIAGAILFCIGGIMMVICLLMSAFAKSYSKEERYLQQKFKERIAELQATVHPITKAPTPGESKIPVTLSKVQNVQPTSET